MTSVDEERRFNPRLGGEIGEADFVGYMNNLRLAASEADGHRRAGQSADAADPESEAALPLPTRLGAADLHLRRHLGNPAACARGECAATVQIVDVREPDEFTGPLGHIRGAKLIPLGELPERAGELARERPIVAVCRAGSRSAQATSILQKAGFGEVANLAGGMLRWRAEGHAGRGRQPLARNRHPQAHRRVQNGLAMAGRKENFMMPAEYDVTGKVVFITGAGRGIGKGIAQVLAEAGADVALNALTPKYVDGTAAEIAAASGRRVVPIIADVTKPDEVRRAVDTVLATFGRIDVLVNALGDSIRKPLVTLPGSTGQRTPAFPTTSCGSSWTST